MVLLLLCFVSFQDRIYTSSDSTTRYAPQDYLPRTKMCSAMKSLKICIIWATFRNVFPASLQLHHFY